MKCDNSKNVYIKLSCLLPSCIFSQQEKRTCQKPMCNCLDLGEANTVFFPFVRRERHLCHHLKHNSIQDWTALEKSAWRIKREWRREQGTELYVGIQHIMEIGDMWEVAWYSAERYGPTNNLIRTKVRAPSVFGCQMLAAWPIIQWTWNISGNV